jgi:hypothetical protein
MKKSIELELLPNWCSRGYRVGVELVEWSESPIWSASSVTMLH